MVWVDFKYKVYFCPYKQSCSVTWNARDYFSIYHLKTSSDRLNRLKSRTLETLQTELTVYKLNKENYNNLWGKNKFQEFSDHYRPN